jgi:hypothetical protein
MSEKNTEGNNVLLFKRVASHSSRAVTVASELRELLVVYDQLIVLLRETYDDGLDSLTDDLVVSVVGCREALENGLDDKTGLEMVKKMRAGLREIPRILRSILPGLGPRLGESIERKLGVQFSKY